MEKNVPNYSETVGNALETKSFIDSNDNAIIKSRTETNSELNKMQPEGTELVSESEIETVSKEQLTQGKPIPNRGAAWKADLIL